MILISKTIQVNIYCDEIKEARIKFNFGQNQKWIYMGLLIVPVTREENLIQELLNRRCGNPSGDKIWIECNDDCEHHKKNNKEVHYQKLNSKDKYFIAKRWLNFFIEDKKLTHYYLLGINLTNLDFSYFGNKSGSERFSIIYNRFFRTAVQKSVKSYFSNYSKIIIDNVVHDKTDLEFTNLFPWHSIYRLEEEDEKMAFNSNEIEFLDSDHRISLDKRSNLIQYSDLILGMFFNCLHFATDDEDKNNLSFMLYPLIHKILNEPSNINSSGNYVNRLDIDFFPKHKLKNMNELEKKACKLDSFYKKRELRIKRLNQLSLF